MPYRGARPTLDDVPLHDDENVYEMISHADTVGVFQIESRAQMSMLPRLKPVTYLRPRHRDRDRAARVRSRASMVHPYLRRRKGARGQSSIRSRRLEREAVPRDPRVEDVLERTLGVPIFQEQVMKLIEVVAGFTPGEADELRRAMAAWKRRGGLERFHDKIRDGMLERGYDARLFRAHLRADQGFRRIWFSRIAFGEFRASRVSPHRGSSTIIPAAFTCALLNAQPMGFYQPSQLIQDAQRHGVIGTASPT